MWVWRYIHIKDLGPKDSGSEGNGAGWREKHAHGVYLFKISVHFPASPARRTTQAHLPGLCTFPLGQGPVQACLPSHPLVHSVEQLVSDCPCCLALLISFWNFNFGLQFYFYMLRRRDRVTRPPLAPKEMVAVRWACRASTSHSGQGLLTISSPT